MKSGRPVHDSGPKGRINNRFKRTTFLKVIPIVGIILLLALILGNPSAPNDSPGSLPSFNERLVQLINEFSSSFNFSDMRTLSFTILLSITLWTSYKYWAINWRILKGSRRTVEKILYAIILLIFVNNHVRLNSLIGKYADWLLFLIFLFILVSGVWTLAKIIDRIDLRSDLYLWMLRLIGGVIILFGVLLLTSSTFALTLTNSTLVFNNIYWIASICLILLGMFMQFRSFRREPALMIWG